MTSRSTTTAPESNTRRNPAFALLALVALALVLGALAPVPASAAIQTTADIQAAINAAPAGGTVTIPAGTFTGSLKISGKSGLTLQGQGAGTVLQSPGRDEILGVANSTGITLRNFAVKGDYSVTGQRGVSFNGGNSNVLVEDLTVRDVGFSGIYSNGTLSDAVFRRLTVTHSGDFGIHIQAASTGLISRIVIEDSDTSVFASRKYPGHGIYIKRANNVTIRRSSASRVAKLSGNGSGGYQITQSTNVVIEDSVAYDNAESGFILDGSGATFLRSSGWNNPGGDFYECDSAAYTIKYVDSSGSVRVWPSNSGSVARTMTAEGAPTAAPAPRPAGPFRDVPADHIFASYIESVKDKGLMDGYTDGRFGPNDHLLRAQFAKILAGTVGLHTQSLEYAFHNCFSDVAAGSEYPHDYVEEAAHGGIVEGRSNGTFGPFERITRAQLAVMIVRAAEGSLARPASLAPGFADMGNLTPEFKEAIAIAKHNGILSGYPDSTYRPRGYATRGQMAKAVYLLAQKM